MKRESGFPHDPVCGRKMNRQKAYAVITYKHREYLLCCPLCQTEFEKAPDKYAAHPNRR